MPRILNWELMSHPTNWVIIILMVAVAAFAVELVASQFQSAAA